jgi:hypothetical protein
VYILVLIFLIVLIVALVLIISFITLRINIRFSFKYKGKSYIRITLLKGLISLKFDLFLITGKGSLYSFNKSKKGTYDVKISLSYITEKIKNIRNQYPKHEKNMSYIFSKIKVQSISILAYIGLGDAAATALIIGILYAFLSNVIFYLTTRVSIGKHNIDILPVYTTDMCFKTNINCIIDIKIGHIITVGNMMMMQRIRQKVKGGDTRGRTSYRGNNENYHGKH